MFSEVKKVKKGKEKHQKKINLKHLIKHIEDDFTLVEEDCVRDCLNDLKTHKFMGLDGMQPRVLT